MLCTYSVNIYYETILTRNCYLHSAYLEPKKLNVNVLSYIVSDGDKNEVQICCITKPSNCGHCASSLVIYLVP